MTTLDYESLETYLGDQLRRSDVLDIHADHFFPVSLLDRLFHYSENTHGTAFDGERKVHRNFHGHDFDRWLDNLIARTLVPLKDDGDIITVELLDIDSMIFTGNDTPVMVTLPDETTYPLMLPDHSAPISVASVEDLTIAIDLTDLFNRPPVDDDSDCYHGFGLLAHVIRTVCEKSSIDPSKVDPHQLSELIFDYFKDELLDLIPSLWNDLNHIGHYVHPVIVIRR